MKVTLKFTLYLHTFCNVKFILGLRENDPECPIALEAIDLSSNFISSLRQHDLHQTASSLKKLNIGSNRLTYLSDDAFTGMTSLQVLNLGTVSHKMSQITIFGLKHKIKNFIKKN